MKVHGYVWGARGASWDRVGHFLLRVADRFSVDRAIWSTALAPSPWDDMSRAALAFGRGSYSSSVNWVPMLDPSERAGALMIRSRGIVDLYLFDEGRSITKVTGVSSPFKGWHPFRMRLCVRTFRWYRCAQPPANGF